MGPLAEQPALRFGDACHDVADLVLVGVLTGEWPAFEEVVARGLALEAHRRERPAAAERRELLTAFRYERSLIAAAEFEAWLAERSLSLADVTGVLTRRWLRAHCVDAAVPPARAGRAAAVLPAEARCDGILARCAAELRAWLAAGRSEATAAEPARVEDAVAGAAPCLPQLDPAELRRRATRLAALAAGYGRFCAVAVPADAVEARVAERRLEWTVVTGRELSFAREGAARETRLRVQHDGEPLAAVAGALGLDLGHREVELGAAPPDLGPQLLAAREGDLVGPWSEHDRWRVLEVERHFRPDAPADPALLARAREELLGELVERLAAGQGEIVAAL